MPAPPPVLLVDGHEDSRLIYAAALAHHDFPVVVSDGRGDVEALVREHRPWLLVVEMSVATDPAWLLAERVLAGACGPVLPVVAVSSTGLDEHRDRALRMGCAAWLAKPLPPRALLAEVERQRARR